MSKDVDNNCLEAKAILIGEAGVGKTNLINVSVGKKFENISKTTSSSNYVRKNYEIDGIKYIVNLWDTAGQERLKSMTKLFFKGSDIVIYVYDITSEQSFISLKNWIDETSNLLENKYVAGIVGNKNDLFLEEKVKENDARNYAESKGMKFKLVSAKTDPKSFISFLEELLKDSRQNLAEKATNISLKNNDKTKNKKCKC